MREKLLAEVKELEERIAAIEARPKPLTYSRVVGYYQNTQGWNPGKKEEWKERKKYDISFLKEEPQS